MILESSDPADAGTRNVLVRIVAASDSDAVAMGVVAAGEWEAARTVLPEAARRAAAAGTSLTLLVPWQAPPERFPRNDGVVRSFIASPELFAAAHDAATLDDCCYQVLARVLSGAGQMVDRLSVLQMGSGAPSTVPLAGGRRAEDACVVVPHRGSLNHLEVCLASLARQTVRPARVQVCLDEPVTAAHEALMERFPGVEYFATEPSGVGPYVGRQALGMEGVEEVVVWHDSDDASCTDRLQVSHDHLRTEGLELAGCHELRLDEIDRRVEAVRFPLAVTQALDIGPSHALFHPTSLVRREAFRRAGGFSTAHRYGSDAHFLYRAHFFLRRVENVDAFLYVRRMRPGSLTTGAETRWASPERERQRARWREDFERVRTGAASIEETSLWTAPADPMPRVRRAGVPRPPGGNRPAPADPAPVVHPRRTAPTSGPAAPERPAVHVRHGDTRPDPYAWLAERGSPAVIEHLEAENRHLEMALGHTRGLRDRLYDEMAARIAEVPGEPPHTWGPYTYYTRNSAGLDHPVHCRTPRGGGAEEVLLDLNRTVPPGAYAALRAFAVSPDHRYLAYALDETGQERFTVRIRDLDRGCDLPERIESTYGEVVWGEGGRSIYYTNADAANRPFRLMRRALGTAGPDVCLYEEPDHAFFAHVGATSSGRFLVLTLRGRITTESRVLDLLNADGGLRTLFPRRRGVRYEPVERGGRWYVRTNDGAPTFRILSAPVGGESGPWTEVLTARDAVEITSLEAFARHLVLHEREAGVPRIRVLDADGGSARPALPEWAMSMRPEVNRDFTAAVYRVVCASPVHPPRVLEIPLDGGEPHPLGAAAGPPGHRPEDYRIQRLWARAPDGLPVPLTVVARVDRLDSARGNPTLLTGYGAYGIVEDLGFRAERLSLLDRGVVLAVAHVRGGGFLGPDWAAGGRRRGKENAIRDFLASAEHMLDAGIARRGALGIHGASAGGVLVGAAVNRRPELFGAAIAEAPFVDVLTTSFDESLPGTVAEWEEWGDPRDPADYAVMRGYSPYDCIAPGRCPHVLATTALNDWRVGYWEAAKWVARLRSASTGDARILLKVDMNAGHHGRTGRYQRLEDLALQYAFLLDALGVTDRANAPGAGEDAPRRAA